MNLINYLKLLNLWDQNKFINFVIEKILHYQNLLKILYGLLKIRLLYGNNLLVDKVEIYLI